MDKITARAGLVLGVAALWKIGSKSNQESSRGPVLAGQGIGDGLILRQNILDTKPPSVPFGTGFPNTNLSGYSETNFNNAGSRIADKPYTALGLRTLVDQPLFDATSMWTFYVVVFVAAQNMLYIALQSSNMISNITPRILDSGLISLASQGLPQALVPGADIISTQLFFSNNGLASQSMFGYNEIYGTV
jgi:hypothetical protein